MKNTPGVQFADNILTSDYTNNLAQFKSIVKSKFTGTIFENSRLPKFSDRDYMDAVESGGMLTAQDMVDAVEQLQNLFTEALVEASENYQAADSEQKNHR